MTNSLGSLIRFILPLALVYLIYNSFGAVAALLALIVFILSSLILNRGMMLQNQASKKYQKGDFEGALNDLKAAVAKDPKNAKIRSTYAFLLLKLGYHDEAGVQLEEAFKTAPEADKNSMKVTKALILWKQGKLDEAIDLLTELIKDYETTNVYATLGFLLIEKGDLERALEFNLQAKDYNSSSPIILDNLGTTYFLLGEVDKALETHEEAMKCKPNFPEAFYNYARVLEKTGDIEKALYMTRHALTLRFWNTSTVTKEEVEAYMKTLEEKEQAFQAELAEKKKLAREAAVSQDDAQEEPVNTQDE
jgi:tetratricopeptide (TPR) repeat protein